MGKQSYKPGKKKKKRQLPVDISPFLNTSFKFLATHEDVQFLISKDHIFTQPPCFYMGTAAEMIDNIVYSKLILNLKEYAPADTIIKKFGELLLSAGINSNFGDWKLFRQPIEKSDREDQTETIWDGDDDPF